MIRGVANMAPVCGVHPLTLRNHLSKASGYPAWRDEKNVWVFGEDFEKWWTQYYAFGKHKTNAQIVTASEMRRIAGMANDSYRKLVAAGLPIEKGDPYVCIDAREAAEWLIPQGGRKSEWGKNLLAYAQKQ